VKRKLKIIHSESQRCQRVVQNLLSFARKHRPEKSLVDVNAILGSVLSLLSYQLRVDGIEVRTALDPGVPGVLGDHHLLQQVFLNIINNAHQAMREPGGSRTLHISSAWIGPDDAGGAAGMLRVEIRDTGPGIPPENLKRIFDPFFTTKTTGQGTGLGLSLAHRTIHDHGGQVYARSQLEKGTTFVVELPRGLPEEEASSDARAGEGPPPEANRPRSILVVDDEPALGELLVEALSSEGHRVHSVANGLEALRLIRQGEYDVIISDLKMPRMDGHQLFEQVRQVKPELAKRMIFSTGDVASAQTQAFLTETGAPFIVKPFDIRDVQRTIARVLAPEES
jgi:two-component system NtrC family sensor kinase